MLPRQHRLNRTADLRRVLRRGRRFAISELVVSVEVRNDDLPSRLSVVTPKIVGNSVVRHRVARVVRHAFIPVLQQKPLNIDVVVRCQSGSETLSLMRICEVIFQAIAKAERSLT